MNLNSTIKNFPEEQQEFVMEYCLTNTNTYEEDKSVKKLNAKRVGRKSMEVKDNFYTAYYEWVINPDCSINQVIQKLEMAKGTFYKKLKELGLKKKTEVAPYVRSNKILKGISDGELILVREMSCKQALEVVKRAIAATELVPKWAYQVDKLNETVCVHILLELGTNRYWQRKQTSAICEELGISRGTYDKHKDRGSFELYCNLVQQQIQFEP